MTELSLRRHTGIFGLVATLISLAKASSPRSAPELEKHVHGYEGPSCEMRGNPHLSMFNVSM